MTEQLLKQLGYGDKEITVYLTVLKYGKIIPARVAKMTGINRSTVYAVAQELVEKGVISLDLGNKIFYLNALPVEKIKEAITREKQRLEKKEKIAKQAEKELAVIARSENFSVPKIRFVEEDDLERFLYNQQEIWVRNAEKFDRSCWGFQDHSFAENFQKWIDWAWKKFQLDVNLLSNRSEIEKRLRKEMSNKRIIKFWEKNINFSSSLWVMGDYIVMIITRQKPFYAVEIYDAVLAHNLREVFKQIWKSIK